MKQVDRILKRAAQLLENYPAMGPHLSVEQALQKAHQEFSKYWGHLVMAKTSIMDQLLLEGYKLPTEQWQNYSGEEGKRMADVMLNAAHAPTSDDDDDWGE